MANTKNNNERTIEIYGKEITSGKNKFISCSCRIGDGDNATFVNVRLNKDCGYSAVKGLQKIKFNINDSNVKTQHTEDGREFKILYIKKCVGVPYTAEEEQAMKDKQAQKVADLFD